jgi:hypothetical protein
MGPGRLLTDAEINAIDVGEQPERAHKCVLGSGPA